MSCNIQLWGPHHKTICGLLLVAQDGKVNFRPRRKVEQAVQGPVREGG